MASGAKSSPVRLGDLGRPRVDAADAVAISGDGKPLSYGALDRRIDAARGAYAALGLRPGDRVVLLLPSSVEFVVAYFGAHRAGLVVIPLNPLLGVEEVRHILTAMAPALVVAAAPDAPFPVMGRLDAILADTSPSAQLACFGGGLTFDRAMLGAPVDLPPADRGADDEALILFTSGTSGRPKGASHTQGALMNNARHVSQTLRLGADDVLLCPLPLSHVFGQMVMMIGALMAGAELSLVPRPAPAAIFEALEERSATVMAAVPATFTGLTEHGRRQAQRALAIGRRLRLALAGGAPLPSQTAHAFQATFGVPAHQGYGMTEVACCIALERPGIPPTGGVGQICAPLEHRIVSIDGRVADEGELELRGPNLFRGYYVDGVLQPRSPQTWFATGDIVRRDARGRIFMGDRKKEMIIRNGYNVYPSEVEAALASHPAVLMAAVVGVDDPAVGQDVAAFVSLKPGATVAPETLAAWCRERIALYKYPRLIAIMPALPTNPTGKISKRALDRGRLVRVAHV